jgi:hypothetical protein
MRPRRLFERYAREAQEHSHAITNLTFQFDLPPSVVRERFEAFRRQHPLLSWPDAARACMQTKEGIEWMQREAVVIDLRKARDD